jgi:hypothetical protein
MPHLVQLRHPDQGRAVARVEDHRLRLCDGPASVYQLAQMALDAGATLRETIDNCAGRTLLDYDEIYEGRSEWLLLPPIDHPEEPARCLITGTGLTHLRSAESRDAMHDGGTLSDSMVMYRWGVEGGRPAPGLVGVSPEWFYKGCGSILRAQNEPLVIPEFTEGGGEEAEIAGVYLIDREGTPRLLGMAAGNEFSDHVVEEENYLYLAHSELRTCSLGPELTLDAPFSSVEGHVSIRRGGTVIWQRDFLTGEQNMCHSLANLEHHHFKYPQHRRPGDLHVHFFGAAVFSSGEGLHLTDGDEMEISFAGYGRPLRNPLRVEPRSDRLVRVQPL